jgi:hypothetical protein
MPEPVVLVPNDVAPDDNGARRGHRQQLNTSTIEELSYELTSALDGRSFDEAEVPALSCDGIHRRIEALDVPFCRRHQLNAVHVCRAAMLGMLG